MLTVIACITEQHDWRLVILAGLVCLLATFTALSLVNRSHRKAGLPVQGWLAAAAVVMGIGVWATHFVAMLAFSPAIPSGFEFGLTALSVFAAITFSWIGFNLMVRLARPVIGGAVVGIGVGTMHYVGMAGFTLRATQSWDPAFIAASMILGVSIAAAAMAVKYRHQTLTGRFCAAGLLAVAICALHFTGMTALTLTPDPRVVVPDSMLGNDMMIVLVVVATLIIVGFGLAGSIVDQKFANNADAEAQRLRAHVEELEHTKMELESATMQLRAAFDAAEDANRAKSEFLATMSHEIRTPMNGILGMAAVLTESSLTPQQQSNVAIIRDSGEALLGILNDILDLSKIESGGFTLDETDFLPKDLLRSATTLWSSQAAAKGLEFVTECGSDPAYMLNADVSRIRQILHNLISNAIKFTETGRIMVRFDHSESVESDRLTLRFAVIDTGIGLAHDQAERIFQPFVQGDGSTTRRFGGTGLGLAICRKLSMLLGGEIGVDSSPGAGSTFWFTVTARRGAAHAAATPTDTEPVGSSAPEKPETTGTDMRPFDGARILVVDDNPINQKLTGALLTPLAAEIDFADNGRQALEAVQAARYDIVLMDVQMPEMDGLEATQAIRELPDPAVARLPIIALTANAMRGDREKYIEAGMDDYLSKPISPDTLLATVTRYLRDRPRPAALNRAA